MFFRYVDRFWFEGGVFGLIKADSEKIFVVFRGTSEIGNWFLTNAQAHMTTARNLFKGAVGGGIHQGFAKAFADLWLVDPPQSLPPAVNYKLTRFFWPFLMALFTGVPLMVIPNLRPATLHALKWYWLALDVVILLTSVQVALSSGTFERWFGRRKKLVLGPALSEIVPDDDRPVIFTGHSLGGALATLAFVQYWTQTRNRAARLVTFGMPRVGNDEFLQWLEKELKGQFTFVANRGDPVAYLPPAKNAFGDGTRKVTALSAILVAVYLVAWVPYALCYRVKFKSQWADMISWLGPDEGWSILKHSNYKALASTAKERF